MRNCSQVETRERRLEELRNRLLERKYRSKVIDSAFERVRQLERDTILERVVREDSSIHRVRAIFKFDMRLPNLSSIFRKNWQLMVNDDQRLLAVYPSPPMICFTQSRNQS